MIWNAASTQWIKLNPSHLNLCLFALETYKPGRNIAAGDFVCCSAVYHVLQIFPGAVFDLM
jgi:hypothetical protein